tara:strand:+ start:279 stop:944 length:666 start_codon:yes stop_codon:yes gene_type:complete
MNELQRHDLFISSVWTQKIPDSEEINKNLLKDVFENASQNSDPNIYGGRETALTSTWYLKKLFNHAEILAKDIADFMGVISETGKPPEVVCFWGNINKQKEFNPPHVHANSNLSGAYYVKVPNDTQQTEDQSVSAGNICFHDTRLEKCATTPLYKENLGYLDLANYSFKKGEKHNPWLDNVAKFKPEEGLMIIFPSWFLHYVEPNLSSEDRIAISFNISFK